MEDNGFYLPRADDGFSEEIDFLTGVAPARKDFVSSEEVSLEELFKTQLTIARKLQKMITEQGDSYSSRDLKDLISVSTSLVANSHRAGETLKELTTYRLFFETIIEFIRQRQDSFGDELLEHLKSVADEMKTGAVLEKLTKS